MNLSDLMKKLTTSLKVRKIKKVEKWSGNPSNYTSAKAFADASLINFNQAAGRGSDPSNWAKTLIALPVREESDASDVLIDKALFAAVGGHGLQAVTRPDGVSEAKYNSIRRTAGRAIIKGYRQLGRIAPAAIYDIAGLKRPSINQERAVNLPSLAEKVLDSLELMDDAENTFSRLIDIYVDDSSIFAVFIRSGNIFVANLSIKGKDVFLEDIKDISIEKRSMEGSQAVWRQANGRWRFLIIAATSALNRSGAIDSKALFDSFVRFIDETGIYPIINFYHQGDNSRLGEADYVARDENVYIATGLFDDTEYGRAAARGLSSDTEYWGNSIEFLPVDGESLEIDLGDAEVVIPVYTRGINTAISILPEHRAAALFTAHANPQVEGVQMREEIKNELTKLLGDAAIADRFEEVVDGVNRNVAQLIHRESDEVAETEEVVESEEVSEEIDTSEEEVEDEVVESEGSPVVLDESVIPMIGRDLLSSEEFILSIATIAGLAAESASAGIVESLNEQILKAKEREVELVAELAAIHTRLSTLEDSADSRQQQYEDDLPADSGVNRSALTYRPRKAAQSNERVLSYDETARNTLDNILNNTR